MIAVSYLPDIVVSYHKPQPKVARVQSPKFQFLQKELKEVFSDSLMNEEWKKRVRYQIRKQLIFDAIEYRDYNENLSKVITQIQRDVLSGEYMVRPAKRYLSEKSRGLCRQMTLIHPRDLLVLERLSRSIYFELRAKAPSASAYFEPDDGNFAKGFQQSDFHYGSFASWKKFQNKIFGFANENEYIVVTDVANFYDFINFQHLRNIIASLADIREAILDLLIHVLNRLTWTPDFMPLTQTGMPQIETSATRVLANAMLYEVDKVCENSAISNYARFMDDMDVGVNNIVQAKCIVRDLDLTLQSRQLRLNSSKTKILSQKDAFEHFCIEENDQLARLEKLIAKNSHNYLVRKIVSAKYENWLKRIGTGEPGMNSPFRRENGSKIHKYILSLIYSSGGAVPDADLLWLIKNSPNMRATALRYISHSKKNNSVLKQIIFLARNGFFVDDASFVEICGYLLHSRFKMTRNCVRLIREYCVIASKKSSIGLHCAIFVSSKFLYRAEILYLISKNRERISGDFWLCRAAAGIAPRFFGHGYHYSKFQDLIRSFDSEDSYGVLSYVNEVYLATTFSRSLRAYLTTDNVAYPQKLYFPKVLLLLAASKNASISTLIPNMHALHPALRNDPFFRAMGF